jgi:hypothetical protein
MRPRRLLWLHVVGAPPPPTVLKLSHKAPLVLGHIKQPRGGEFNMENTNTNVPSTGFRKAVAALGVAVASSLVFAGAASAQAFDPVTETTTFLSAGIQQIGLIILAVAAGAVALLVLNIGIRMAWGALKSRGQRAV